jgi:hypothetical protein
MAIRNALIEATPEEVWSVLSDGYSYADWVVGTAAIRAVDEGWPEPGTSIHYSAGQGPLRVEDKTTSRLCRQPSCLELEAHMLTVGTLRVAIRVLPWGENVVVAIDEHPLRGPSLVVDNPLIDFSFTLRNRRLLRNLERVVKGRIARTARL